MSRRVAIWKTRDGSGVLELMRTNEDVPDIARFEAISLCKKGPVPDGIK